MRAIGILFVATLAACEGTTSSSGPSQVALAPSQIHAVGAQSAAFAAYRTFGFRLAETPPPPYQVSARSFDVERRAHDLVAEELTRKGYTESTTPDFFVRLSSGTAKEDKPQPTTTSGGNENETQSVTAGAIVIDAFDRSTSQQVWHGTARAEVDPQRVNDAGIQAAVQQMMASFPARNVAPAQQ
jgi:hypothetical protein